MSKKTETIERPPIIAIMGHVDHGKSTLLDFIRKSNVVETESAGITQHISAYEVIHEKKRITFLDTPGHEAFSAIRQSGIVAADIAVLVVAADDGVKPQTIEAFKAIKSANIPFVVAINKIDKNDSNVESTKASLAENEIYLEGYGGDVPNISISALKGDGVSDLMDTILLVAEVEELKGQPETDAEGFVIESHIDTKKGISATLVITNGTLRVGDFLVSGESYTPVRFIENYLGEKIESATFSQPILITSWNTLPHAGKPFFVVKSKKEAEEKASSFNRESEKMVSQSEEDGKVSVPVIVKSDAHGTLDAVLKEIGKISLERVRPKIILSGIGQVTENDIRLALAKENSLVVGFNSSLESRAEHLVERESVNFKSFSVIYELTKWVEEELQKQSPTFETEEVTGQAKILKIFSQSKNKQVIGGRLEEGMLKKDIGVKILRRDNEIGEGVVKELQQNKNNVSEITDGEFGTMIESKTEIAPGDKIKSIVVVQK